MGVVGKRYVYMESLLALSTHQSPSMSLHCTLGRSSLNLGSLHPYLSGHPDPQFASYVFLGLRDGFHIGFSNSSPLHSLTHNHTSSRDNPNAVAEHLSEELRLIRQDRWPRASVGMWSRTSQSTWPRPKASLRQMARDNGLVSPEGTES